MHRFSCPCNALHVHESVKEKRYVGRFNYAWLISKDLDYKTRLETDPSLKFRTQKTGHEPKKNSNKSKILNNT